MSRVMKAVLPLIVAVVAVLPLAAGGQGETGPAAGEAAGQASEGALVLPVVKQPLEITVWKQNHSKADYADGMAMWSRVAERTGIVVRFKTIPAGTSDDQIRALSLEIAAGAKLDVYCAGKNELNQHGDAGAFIDLEPLVTKYAPTIGRYLLDDKEARDLCLSNAGKMYAVCQMPAIKAKTGFLVRKDWMDKLDQRVPVTPDDWLLMLRAFRDRDPNGNGRQDEIPFFVRTVLDDIWSWGTAFNAETYRESEWALRDGKFVYGATEPQFKEFLVYVHKLYEERLLDQEYLTRPSTFRDDALRNNIGGSTHDWFASTFTRADKYAKDVPGMKLLGVAPPSIPGRSKPFTRIQMEPVRDPAWSISVNNKHPVETIKMMEYVFSDEGMILLNFGIEGVHYNRTAGGYLYTDLIAKDPDGISEAINRLGSGNFPYRQHPDYERQFATADAYVARALYDTVILPTFPVMRFSESDSLRVADLRESARTYRDEMVNKFIVGTEPLAKFDDFVAQLRKIGAAELEKLYAESYARYLAAR